MGNPAGMIKKKREKRRKKFEARLSGMAYIPKVIREEILAEEKKAAQK